ncbi:MAG: ATP-binding protein [Acidimicrobiaceae bacterium]|nr:ATP-binding protein [Acidimicrobiaceae bacterium]
MEFIERHIRPEIEAALEWSRVVMIHGARQTGKTTLVRGIAEARGGTYVSLDDDEQRESVLLDPVAFLSSQRYPLAIDEVQLGGNRVIVAVKRLVDEDQTPGRFILTGSTNFLTVPNISESLAGRVRLFRLWPLSEAELVGVVPTEIDHWFEGAPRPAPVTDLSRADYFASACRGGYPEVVSLDQDQRRHWFDDYIETVVQRDILALADIRRAASLPRLLCWAAASTSSEMNRTDAAKGLRVSRSVIASYFEWLQTVFLVHELPAWSRNLSSRTTSRPKIHITDAGLAASLLDVEPEALASPTSPAAGPLLETFAVGEIARQLVASPRKRSLYHWRNHRDRDHRDREVDLLIEAPNGDVVAVEIKATSSPSPQHTRHLRWLRDKIDVVAPGAFQAGILLHTGPLTLSLGDRIHMRPIGCLWTQSTQ